MPINKIPAWNLSPTKPTKLIDCKQHPYDVYKNGSSVKSVCSAKPVLSTSEKTKGIAFECKNGEIQPIRNWLVPGGNVYGSDLKELIFSTQALVDMAKPYCLKDENSTIEIRKSDKPTQK